MTTPSSPSSDEPLAHAAAPVEARKWRGALTKAGGIFLVAVVAGPPLGAIFFCIFFALAQLVNLQPPFALIGLVFLLLTCFLCTYPPGILPAACAGMIFAVANGLISNKVNRLCLAAGVGFAVELLFWLRVQSTYGWDEALWAETACLFTGAATGYACAMICRLLGLIRPQQPLRFEALLVFVRRTPK